MAILTGLYGLRVNGTPTVTSSEIEGIQKAKQDFKAVGRPLHILNLSSLYLGPEQFQLVTLSNPLYGINQDKRDIFFTSSDCFKYIIDLSNQKNYEKIWIWEEYRCEKRSVLPLDFFIRPPFVHPSGHSYTYLAFKLPSKEFYKKDWVYEHIEYFHVNELPELKKFMIQLPYPYSFLEELAPEEISNLSKGMSGFINSHYVVWRSSFKSIYSDLDYKVFKRSDFDQFLKKGPYVIFNSRPGQRCLVKEDKICWAHNTGHLSQLAGESGMTFFAGSIFLMTIVLAILLNKIKQQKKEEERQRLALQVLTHEFRTPVASILLVLESLNKRFNDYDNDTQDTILRLSSEGHRLNRLVQTTRNYLRLQRGNKFIENKWIKISSINEFIQDQLAQVSELFLFVPLSKDESFVLDPYWAGICIKNILENSLSHGLAPHTVIVKMVGQYLDITVQDMGECSFKTLDEMSSAFIRGPRSRGTGLGLNIVRKILKDIEGELFFTSHPTQFCIRLKNQKKKLQGQNRDFSDFAKEEV